MTTQALTTNDFALIDGRNGLAEFLFANQKGLTLNDATVLAEKIVASWLPNVLNATSNVHRTDLVVSHPLGFDRYHGAVAPDGRRRF